MSLRPLLRNKSHCDKPLRRRKSGAILSNPPFDSTRKGATARRPFMLTHDTLYHDLF